MNTMKKTMLASIAFFGLAMGQASAAPLNIDTINVDLDLTIGSFNPGQVCASEFECSFDFFGPVDDWLMTGGPNDGAFGAVTELDLWTLGGTTLDPAPFGYLDVSLDDGSQLLIDLIEFGTDAQFSAFGFIGEIDGGVGPIYNDFISFGTTVGIVLTGGDAHWDANIVNVPSNDVPEPSTLLLLGLGLAGFGLSRRRKLR